MSERPADASTPLSIREPPKILVPIEVLEGQTIPTTLVEFLAPAEVVVLGYHVLPEQTPTEQASLQFEERAQSAVDDVAHAFRDVGRTAETRLAFTHDRDQTVERVAAEVGATAILLPNPTGDVDSLLVAIRGEIDTDRLADLVATLLETSDAAVTLWGLAGDAASFDADAAVADARETLLDRGLSPDRIGTETTASDGSVRDVVDRAGEFDVIVVGKGERTLSSVLFGDETERIADGTVAPVLVVRGRPVDEE